MASVRKLIHETTLFVRRIINSPVGELTRAQRVMRYWIDLGWHCARALRHDRAGEMAAALTYRTIFSLIPLLVTALLVFQAFKGLDEVRADLQPMIYKFMGVNFDYAAPAEVDDYKPEFAVKPPDTAPQEQKIEADKQVKLRVDDFLSSVTSKITNINFGSIGAVGFVLFIWAAIDLVVTLELSFNRVFNSPTGRPWSRRIPIYWAIMTLGPVLVWLSISVAGRVVGAAEQVPVLGTIVSWGSPLFALAASWLLLFLLYKLMPNTVVNVKSALAGAFVAAILWELGKFGFKLYVTKALPYANIYGALGLIPLFLFWVYITWVIVLFGLELTYTLQAMKGKRFKYELPSAHTEVPGDPDWIIPIMAQIGEAFEQGKPVDSQTLADRLSLPDRVVSEMNVQLEKAGLIHRVEAGEEEATRFALSLPPQQIGLQRLLDVADTIRHKPDAVKLQAGWAMLRKLSEAQRVAAADLTLASLLKENGKG